MRQAGGSFQAAPRSSQEHRKRFSLVDLTPTVTCPDSTTVRPWAIRRFLLISLRCVRTQLKLVTRASDTALTESRLRISSRPLVLIQSQESLQRLRMTSTITSFRTKMARSVETLLIIQAARTGLWACNVSLSSLLGAWNSKRF